MSVQEVTSAQNAKFKRWLSLLDSRGIKKEKRALLSGPKLIQEFLQQQPERVEEILLPPKAAPLTSTQLATALGPAPLQQTRLSAPLFQALDVIGTRAPLAVIRPPELKTWDLKSEAQGLELIVALSDPSNLGSCLRSAEAFGARRVILAQESSSPFLPKALRASSGSALRLDLYTTGPLAQLPELANAIGLDMGGTRLETYPWPENVYLVLGEEGQGLPLHLKIQRLAIPMQAPVESLNATVAAAIAMFSYRTGVRVGHARLEKS